jgi:choloylglycine hydrolase
LNAAVTIALSGNTGCGFPLGGINEAGLVVEVMWHAPRSEPPAPDARGSVNELQWIQYQLDNYEKVSEVEAHKEDVRISKIYADVHYLVCDRDGECATFENLGGKLEVRSGTQLKVATLTNSSYDNAVKNLASFKGFGGTTPIPTGSDSDSRFIRASALAQAFDPMGKIDAVDAAFDLLNSVGPTSYSKFHIVYEPKIQKVHFRTWTYKGIKEIRLEDLGKPEDLTCDQKTDKTRTFNMAQDVKGDIHSLFKPYSAAENRKMVLDGFTALHSSLTKKLAEQWADHPSSVSCP